MLLVPVGLVGLQLAATIGVRGPRRATPALHLPGAQCHACFGEFHCFDVRTATSDACCGDASAQRSQLRGCLMDPAGAAAFAQPKSGGALCYAQSSAAQTFALEHLLSRAVEDSDPCVQPSASHKAPASHLPFERPSCPATCPVICCVSFGA